MVVGKIRFTGVSEPPAAAAWMRFPKDTVLLISASLTRPQSKLFRAAAKTRHRRDGTPLMEANNSAGKSGHVRLRSLSMYNRG